MIVSLTLSQTKGASLSDVVDGKCSSHWLFGTWTSGRELGVSLALL